MKRHLLDSHTAKIGIKYYGMLKTQTSFSKDYFKLMPCILITCFGFIISYNWGVLVFLKFAQFSSELTKTWSSGATKCKISIGKCNVKV